MKLEQIREAIEQIAPLKLAQDGITSLTVSPSGYQVLVTIDTTGRAAEAKRPADLIWPSPAHLDGLNALPLRPDAPIYELIQRYRRVCDPYGSRRRRHQRRAASIFRWSRPNRRRLCRRPGRAALQDHHRSARRSMPSPRPCTGRRGDWQSLLRLYDRGVGTLAAGRANPTIANAAGWNASMKLPRNGRRRRQGRRRYRRPAEGPSL